MSNPKAGILDFLTYSYKSKQGQTDHSGKKFEKKETEKNGLTDKQGNKQKDGQTKTKKKRLFYGKN